MAKKQEYLGNVYGINNSIGINGCTINLCFADHGSKCDANFCRVNQDDCLGIFG